MKSNFFKKTISVSLMSLSSFAFCLFLEFVGTSQAFAASAQITIGSPAPSSTSSGNTVNLIYGKSGDFTTVSHVHLQLDGNPVVEDSAMSGSYTFYNVISGQHVIKVSLANSDHSVISGSLVQVSFSVVNGDPPGTSDVNAPVITPNGGTVTSATPIIMSSNNPDSVIYYSTNTIVGAVYTAPIYLSQSTKLIAFARRPGHADSPVTIVDFIVSGSVVTPPVTTPPVTTPPVTTPPTTTPPVTTPPTTTPPVVTPPVTVPPVVNSTVYESGTLVNDDGTIYVILRKEKVPFTNMEAFIGLGYSLSNVIKGDVSGYPLPPGSYNLHSPTQDHAWGTWLNYNGTIYYSDPSGLIGAPSWEVFISNGGNSKYILKANNADLAVLSAHPNLPLLVANDSRVVR